MKNSTSLLLLYTILFIISISFLTFFEFSNPSLSGTPIYRFGPDDSCFIQVHDNPYHYQLITISTHSMSPTISPGDQAISVSAERYGIENITKGTIIVYKRGDSLICHRVYSVHSDGFYTKGDANSSPDSSYVYHSEVQSVVIAIFWKTQTQ